MFKKINALLTIFLIGVIVYLAIGKPNNTQFLNATKNNNQINFVNSKENIENGISIEEFSEVVTKNIVDFYKVNPKDEEKEIINRIFERKNIISNKSNDSYYTNLLINMNLFENTVDLKIESPDEYLSKENFSIITNNLIIFLGLPLENKLQKEKISDIGLLNSYSKISINKMLNNDLISTDNIFNKLNPKEFIKKSETYKIFEKLTDLENIYKVYYTNVSLNNKIIKISDSKEYVLANFGVPNHVINSAYYWDWLVYYTDFSDLILIGIFNNQVVSIATNSNKAFFGDIKVGDHLSTINSDLTKKESTLFLFDNINNNLDGIYINLEENISNRHFESLALVNYYFTNGFRVKNNLMPLEFNSLLEKSANAHSLDMASQNYFNHVSLDGTTFDARINKTGLNYSSCGENLAMGNSLDGVASYLGLINSAGHRKNILDRFNKVGVSVEFSEEERIIYFTQNFAKSEEISLSEIFEKNFLNKSSKNIDENFYSTYWSKGTIEDLIKFSKRKDSGIIFIFDSNYKNTTATAYEYKKFIEANQIKVFVFDVSEDIPYEIWSLTNEYYINLYSLFFIQGPNVTLAKTIPLSEEVKSEFYKFK